MCKKRTQGQQYATGTDGRVRREDNGGNFVKMLTAETIQTTLDADISISITELFRRS